jgi:outer membrane protein OmpU
MKKILLGTSALIGAATLYAGAALAEDPKVTVGGFNTFEAGFSKSDFDQNERDRAFRNDTEVHFNVAGKTDGGLGYGAEIDLQADIDGAGNSAPGSSASGNTESGIVAHRTYGWLQGDNWGHLEFGSNDGAARTLKVDASNIARATGGIDGDYKYFSDVNTSAAGVSQGAAGTFSGAAALASTPNFITSPRLPVENGPANGFSSDLWGNDDKITYYTPRFAGFQLGVSYAPSLTNRGELTSRTDFGGVATGTTDVWKAV